MNQISLFAAFGAGLLSFLSPCVLPLIPGYLSFIGGRTEGAADDPRDRGRIFLRTLFFTLGFSAVFVALGVAFSGSGMLVSGRASRSVTVAAGIVIVLFGLNAIFDIVKALNRELRAHVASRPAGAAGAFVVGMAFGAGWTPCIGPVLMSILFMASRAGGAGQGIALLAAYSLGLALPFLAAGLFFERMGPLMAWFKKRGRGVRVASGLLLVAIGSAMALGRLTALNGFFSRLGFGIRAAMARGESGPRLWTAVALILLAAALVVPPLLKRRKVLTAARIIALSAVAILLALDLSGVVSIADALADWFLFQGA